MLVANRASTEVIDVFIDLNKGTVYLSSELFPFFCMYIVLPFSPFILYMYVLLQFLALLASMRIAIFRHFVFLVLLPVYTFFLHSSFLVPAQLFLQFLTFPIPGRSIIIALNGDVQPRIKAPFPFQNILSRPTEHPVGYTWLNHGFVD